LPFKEIAKQYFSDAPKDDKGKPAIKDALKVDQEIIVQVEKEERGNKGAALTSFISLAGRFLVAMPQNPRAGGVSRRIEGEDRDELKKVLDELKLPDGMGVIVRTAGVGRSSEEMQWDLDYLTQVWTAIEKAAGERKAPFLIYQESDIVVRALRDHYRADIGEILIDSESAFQQAQDFMSMVMPGSINKLKRFEDKLPLFNRFQIENQIESAFSREVTLPSGGAIVIDHTEALTSIDVNSARATRGSDIEETAKQTNLEAADELARQLRIRDLGGLIVIDFIDMMQNKNQREVENRLRNAVHEDRARVQIGRISRFGLLEMSRQRLRPSLEESSQIVCPRCNGQGTIRDVESLSLAVLRLLEEESLKENTGKILAKIPVECATYLLNEKREKVDAIEQRRGVHIVIIPDPKLETPQYEIERVKDNDTHRHESNYKKSYEMTTEETPVDLVDRASSTTPTPEKAAVQRIAPPTPRPTPKAAKTKSGETGIIGKILSLFASNDEKTESPEKESEKSTSAGNRQNRGGNRNRRGRGRGGQGRSRNNNASKARDSSQNSKSGNNDSEKNASEKSENSENKKSRSGRSRGGNRSGNRGGNRSRQSDNRNQKDQAAAGDSNSNESGKVPDNAESKADKPRGRPRRKNDSNQDKSAEKSASTEATSSDVKKEPRSKPPAAENNNQGASPQKSESPADMSKGKPAEAKPPSSDKPKAETVKSPQSDNSGNQSTAASQPKAESKPTPSNSNNDKVVKKEEAKPPKMVASNEAKESSNDSAV
ncbi:MAG: Rne/Rng family ribonuclease, partial [Pseudomonadota bacterium]